MNQEATTEKLTSVQLGHRLGISQMTLHLWRRGNTKGIPPLPCEALEHGLTKRVVFDLLEVEKWLKMYRPILAQKIRENNCDCKHCAKTGRTGSVPGRNKGLIALAEATDVRDDREESGQGSI